MLDPLEFFEGKYGFKKFLVVDRDVMVRCYNDLPDSDCSWMFSYPLECRKGEKLYAHLLYSYNGRTHLSTSCVRVNEIVSTFVDEKNDCPDMVKTIKQGQIFVISSFFFTGRCPKS